MTTFYNADASDTRSGGTNYHVSRGDEETLRCRGRRRMHTSCEVERCTANKHSYTDTTMRLDDSSQEARQGNYSARLEAFLAPLRSLSRLTLAR